MAAGRSGRSDKPLIYYRDSSVTVTSDGIEVDGVLTPFDELTRVWHRRHSVSVRAVAGRGALGLSLLAPILTSAAAVLLALKLELSTATRVVIIAAAVLVGLGTALLIDPVLDRMDASFDRGVHQHEIWAERDGVEFRLLATRDAARFGRIYRALQRAVDA